MPSQNADSASTGGTVPPTPTTLITISCARVSSTGVGHPTHGFGVRRVRHRRLVWGLGSQDRPTRRDGEAEDRPAAGRLLDPSPAVVRLGDVLDKSKTDATAPDGRARGS